MSNVVYTYSIAADFPEGNVNTSKLQTEIQNSAIVTALDHISTNDDVLDIIFKAALSNTDKTILDGDTIGPSGGLIAAHDNTPSTSAPIPIQLPSELLDSEGNLKTISEFHSGDKANFISCNWCDKTTWYELSQPITNEELASTDSDNKVFQSDHENWIDLTHGKVTGELVLLIANANKWIPVIKVDGVIKTEDSFESDTPDGDFYIDYKLGRVNFHQPVVGVVTASYYYGNAGKFVVKPSTANKKLTILRVEVQFSRNMVLKDTMQFQAFGYADVFAPQLGLPPGTLIPLAPITEYKHAFDFLNESNGVYPEASGFGGSKRGFSQPVITLPWSYLTKTTLIGAYGMQIVVSTKNNKAHEGELGTVTFYCIEQPI